MGNHRHAWRCTPSGSVHEQTYSLLLWRYPCCMWHCVAFVVTAHLRMSPSLVWRLHRRPGQPHEMLGDGQPPPRMGMHFFRLRARANLRPSPFTLPVLHLASCCTHRVNTWCFWPLACTGAARAAEAPPRHARRWATTATHGGSRPHTLCTCKATVSAHPLPLLHLASCCRTHMHTRTTRICCVLGVSACVQ